MEFIMSMREGSLTEQLLPSRNSFFVRQLRLVIPFRFLLLLHTVGLSQDEIIDVAYDACEKLVQLIWFNEDKIFFFCYDYYGDAGITISMHIYHFIRHFYFSIQFYEIYLTKMLICIPVMQIRSKAYQHFVEGNSFQDFQY